MKKIAVLFILSFTFISYGFADDPYEKLAGELANFGTNVKKLAVIPFSYADNTASTKDGAVISERLTMKLINLQKFEIIERSVLNKVLDELKLQSSGVIDASSAKELGKVLGVDAIITGTLVPTADGKIEVNARIIKTETAQAIGASQVYVVKDWLGGDVQQVQPKPVLQQTQEEKPKQKGEIDPFNYSYFDWMFGFGTQTMDATADPNVPLPMSGIWWSSLQNIKASGVGPIGFRVGGYGKGIVGGDLEISVSRHYTPRQTIVFNSGTIKTMPDRYFDVTSFGISGDLLLRTMGKSPQFYFGLGLGMAINNIKSNYIPDKYGKPLNETDIGLIVRLPIGLRFNWGKDTLFIEWRFEDMSTSFDRGNTSVEKHDLDFSGSRFIIGGGTRF